MKQVDDYVMNCSCHTTNAAAHIIAADPVHWALAIGLPPKNGATAFAVEIVYLL